MSASRAEPPWVAESPPDPEVVRRAYPQAKEIRLLGEGWDFYAFEVDATWIFRVPKRATEAARLEREIRLLDALDDRLPIAVPCYEFRSDSIGGYRKLSGRIAMGHEPGDVAADFGALLTALHDFDAAPDDIPHATADAGNAGFHAWALSNAARMRAALPEHLHGSVDAALEGKPPAYDGPHVLIHDDLCVEHILLDDAGRLTGVIDWTDAVLGDPAADFSGLCAWGGTTLMQDALEHYRRDRDPHFEQRVRYGALCSAISTALYGREARKPEVFRAGVRGVELALRE